MGRCVKLSHLVGCCSCQRCTKLNWHDLGHSVVDACRNMSDILSRQKYRGSYAEIELRRFQSPRIARTMTVFLRLSKALILAAITLVFLQCGAVCSQPMPRSHDGTRPENCFGSSAGSYPVSEKNMQSTVMIRIVTREGRTIAFGTGIIIHNSGDSDNHRNRIITAYHVTTTDPLPPLEDMVISLIAPEGITLGTAAVVQRSRFDPKIAEPAELKMAYASRSRSAKRQLAVSTDMVVLAMIAPSEHGWRAFEERDGVELASMQSDQLLAGEFSSPGGLSHGASGAGALDDTDRVVGIVVAASEAPSVRSLGHTKIGYPNLLLRNGDHTMIGFTNEHTMLPALNRGFVLPVTDRGILLALNAAGKKVNAGRLGAVPIVMGATILAFPHAHCVAFRGFLEELAIRNQLPSEPR